MNNQVNTRRAQEEAVYFRLFYKDRIQPHVLEKATGESLSKSTKLFKDAAAALWVTESEETKAIVSRAMAEDISALACEDEVKDDDGVPGLASRSPSDFQR